MTNRIPSAWAGATATNDGSVTTTAASRAMTRGRRRGRLDPPVRGGAGMRGLWTPRAPLTREKLRGEETLSQPGSQASGSVTEPPASRSSGTNGAFPQAAWRGIGTPFRRGGFRCCVPLVTPSPGAMTRPRRRLDVHVVLLLLSVATALVGAAVPAAASTPAPASPAAGAHPPGPPGHPKPGTPDLGPNVHVLDPSMPGRDPGGRRRGRRGAGRQPVRRPARRDPVHAGVLRVGQRPR